MENEEKACQIYGCDSLKHELNDTAMGISCDYHLSEIENESNDMAMGAMVELGLPENEAEAMLEDAR